MTTSHVIQPRSPDAGSLPFFDATSATWLKRYDENTPGGYALRIRKQRVLELLDPGGGQLLDIGCGAGAMVSDAVALGYRFWGVDGSPRMIETCRTAFRGRTDAHFSVGRATLLAFPNAFFDCVLCMGVIDHVADYAAALREMLRVLRPGGQAIVSFPNSLSPYAVWRNSAFYPLLRAIRPAYFALRGRPAPPALSSRATLFSQRRAVRLLRELGAEVRGVRYFNFNVCLSPIDELLPLPAMRLAKRLETPDGARKWLGCGFLVNARKPAPARTGEPA